MNLSPRIGTELRALRLRLGLKLTHVADRAGVNKGTLLQIERGHRRGSPRVLARLTKVLGPEFSELVRPGQLRLALDWAQAARRKELDAPARAWLREVAQVSLNGNAVEVFELPGPVLVLSAFSQNIKGARAENPPT